MSTAKVIEAEKKRRLAEEEDEQFRLAAETVERDMQREHEEQERRHQKRSSGHTNLSKVRSKDMDFNKFTIKEMQALAYEYYHVTIPFAGLKKLKVDTLKDKLEELYKENKDRLDKLSL
jgi:hypothetical protein